MDVCRALACSLPVEVRQEVGAGKDSKKILKDDIFEFLNLQLFITMKRWYLKKRVDFLILLGVKTF